MSQTPEDPTDEDLLRAHVAGDPDAFGVLFARHRDRLWAVALRTSGDPQDAADGLQDAMVAAFRRAGSFRGDARVTTWLHRVVVNACLDRIRAQKVRAALPLTDAPEDLRGLAVGGPSPAVPVDPADAAVASERRDEVLCALATLPADQRAALVLVDMEGLPVAEVAAILNCPTGTVKSRCSRGRARLAVLLRLAEPAERPPGPRNPPSPSDVPSTEPARGPPVPPRP